MANHDNDRAFEAVLQNTGNIDVFIDNFFSFLARRTDFFVVAPPEGGRVGFPPGLAAKLVISKFKKWADYKTSQKTNEPPPSYLEATSEDTARCQSLPVVHDVEVPHYNQSKKEESIKPSESTPVGSIKKPDSCKKKEPQKVAPAKPPRAVPLADTYNGRKTDKYSWSQSIKELDIYIVVDKNVKNKKNVKVDIQKDKIRVSTGTGAEDEVVTDWHLPHPIIKDESYWSLHPGESVFLSLQKVKEMWWDHLFEGEEILDRKKIDAVRPMEELEDEEQAKIQELVWNQEQKLKGLPTSEESKLENVMKMAWDAEGSPFKGTPFDLSKMQLSSNSINIVNVPPGEDYIPPPPPSS